MRVRGQPASPSVCVCVCKMAVKMVCVDVWAYSVDGDTSIRQLMGMGIVRESPKIKMLRFSGLLSPGKAIGPEKPQKSPGMLKWSWKFYFLVQVSLCGEEIYCNT